MAPPEIMIIEFEKIPYIGKSELSILNKAINQLRSANISVIFSGVNENVRDQLKETEILTIVGEENIFRCIKDVATHAKDIVLRKDPHHIDLLFYNQSVQEAKIYLLNYCTFKNIHS
jgi:MFS superfamily sulfate permease-like transporter